MPSSPKDSPPVNTPSTTGQPLSPEAVVLDIENMLETLLRTIGIAELENRLGNLINLLRHWRFRIIPEGPGAFKGATVRKRLDQLRSVIDSAGVMSKQPAPSSEGELRKRTILLTDCVDSIEAHITSIETVVAASRERDHAKLSDISQDIDRLGDRLEKIRIHHDEQFSELMNRYSRDLSEHRSQQKEAFDAAISFYQSSYQTQVNELGAGNK